MSTLSVDQTLKSSMYQIRKKRSDCMYLVLSEPIDVFGLNVWMHSLMRS